MHDPRDCGMVSQRPLVQKWPWIWVNSLSAISGMLIVFRQNSISNCCVVARKLIRWKRVSASELTGVEKH